MDEINCEYCGQPISSTEEHMVCPDAHQPRWHMKCWDKLNEKETRLIRALSVNTPDETKESLNG